jgi:23S rRNA (cytosine1962-C5)-methyltransferase
MDINKKVVLKSGKEQSVWRRHPWIFSGAIKQIYGNPAEGDLVYVYDNKDELLATGHYQPSSIAVRILDFCEIITDTDFWLKRLTSAYTMREKLGLAGSEITNVYRLVNAEADMLPGLVIDHYNGHLVIQIHSTGIYRNLKTITEVLKTIYGDKLITVFDKSETTMPFKGPIEVKNQFLYGDAKNTIVKENSLKFKVDWVDGQKSGFFIDQRENRKLLMEYSGNRKVLNMFSYTGGFSVYAVAGKAKLVHSVDSSVKAIDLVNENMSLNFPDAPHEAFAIDAFKYLDKIKDKYDLIILDPPAFAKHQNALNNALQGYKRLNQMALEQIRSGGVLFTFSCSQVVTKENFRKSVFAAAANAKRNVRILHQLTQPSDHAISIFHLEGEYLKGLVLYVE